MMDGVNDEVDDCITIIDKSVCSRKSENTAITISSPQIELFRVVISASKIAKCDTTCKNALQNYDIEFFFSFVIIINQHWKKNNNLIWKAEVQFCPFKETP